jgi:hypothetical protein
MHVLSHCIEALGKRNAIIVPGLAQYNFFMAAVI